jgi:hypothetical protein
VPRALHDRQPQWAISNAAVERTRLHFFCARDPPETWRDAGHGTAEFRHRRTHTVFRPIPPDAPPVDLPPDRRIAATVRSTTAINTSSSRRSTPPVDSTANAIT